MLKLRRGSVVSVDPLEVEVEAERRRAWADPALVGPVEVGDEVLVNTEALDLSLGSGGFDVVHANLTRGLEGEGAGGTHVMKLNYTSLQHPVEPAEVGIESGKGGDDGLDSPGSRPSRRIPVLVAPLHGHLAPAAWAAAQEAPQLSVGYVQTPGGALPGTLSQDVPLLRERGLLRGHIAAAPCFGAEHEALGTLGALHTVAERLRWDAIIAGPGPGIIGSATRYGHGGMAALDTAHAALSLGLPALVSPRLSGGDPRPRHRGLSHHTRSVLELCLAPVQVPVPEVDAELWPVAERQGKPGGAYDELLDVCRDRHDVLVQQVDLDGYAASGLPAKTMGRTLEEDRLFFAAALAAGRALARVATS